jgi:hypothetical protein
MCFTSVRIELDNIGRNGTPANERRYSDYQLREAFYTARDIAQLLDDLGFDVLWTAEHHFQREGYEVFLNLIALGLWLATQTRRLKFGCAFNILEETLAPERCQVFIRSLCRRAGRARRGFRGRSPSRSAD